MLYDEVSNFFEQDMIVKPEEAACDYWCSEEKTRGRQEKREVWTSGDLDWIPQLKDWCDLQSITCVRLTKTEKGKKTCENRYYISSLLPKAEKQGRSVRSH